MSTMKKVDFTEMFEMKKAMMDELENILKELGYRESGLLTTYEEDGEEQRTDRDGNLLYLDENGEKTTEVTDRPYMRTTYKDIKVKPEDLCEYDARRYKAIQQIKDALMALV